MNQENQPNPNEITGNSTKEDLNSSEFKYLTEGQPNSKDLMATFVVAAIEEKVALAFKALIKNPNLSDEDIHAILTKAVSEELKIVEASYTTEIIAKTREYHTEKPAG